MAVLGLGGVGGCLAAVLARGGVPVTCIVRESTVPIIREHGLILDSVLFGRYTVRPEAAERLRSPTDILFIATKAYDLDAAMDRINPESVQSGMVIPLLNGLEHTRTLRQRLGARVAAGSIRIVSESTGPGRILHTSPFVSIEIASDGDVDGGRLSKIAAFLSGLGLETRVRESEAGVLWEKLARLAALSCMTTLTNRPIGELRSDPARRAQLRSLISEAAEVAGAEGVDIDPDVQMAIIDGLPKSLTSSMQRDRVRGQPCELDAIAGSIVRAGAAKGLKCPAFRGVIREIETRS